MESCSFSTFLIFLWILNYYLDQLMPSSIIKDLMDPLLSVDYTWSKMQEILSTRCVTQQLSISDLLVKTLTALFFFLCVVQCSLFRFEIQTLLRKILVCFTPQLPFQTVIVVLPSPLFGNCASTENAVWAIIYIGYPFDGSGSKVLSYLEIFRTSWSASLDRILASKYYAFTYIEIHTSLKWKLLQSFGSFASGLSWVKG